MELLLELAEKLIEWQDEQNDILSMLFENLGNIKIVDKDLLKALKTAFIKNNYSSAKISHKDRGSNKLFALLGKDSSIEELPANNVNQAIKHINDNDNKVAATIIKYGEKQVLALVHTTKAFAAIDHGKYHSKTPNNQIMVLAIPDFFNIVGSEAKYKEHMPKVKNKSPMGRGAVPTGLDGYLPQELVKGLSHTYDQYNHLSLTGAQARKVINYIFECAKEDNVKISIINIMQDENRGTMSVARQAAIRGRIPKFMPKSNKHFSDAEKKEYDLYAERLKVDFKNKLAKFKLSKEELKHSNNNAEDILKAAIEEGYPDTMRMFNQIYKRREVQINGSSMLDDQKENRTGRTWNNYVSYEIEKDTSSFKTLCDEMAKLLEILPETDEELEDEEYAPLIKFYMTKYNELVPPNKVFVVMGFKGGSIVPISVEFSEKDYWKIRSFDK